MQLHAHTSLWAEPAEWAGRLALVIDPHDAMAPHVWAAMANAAAHAGRLTDGLQLAERALASDDLRAVAVALEAIADIAMYQGDLARCRDAARRLGDVGRRLDDLHATVLGHVDQALALVYADDHDAALPILDGLDRAGLAPSDRAWILYAEGEALAKVDPVRSLEAFEQAIDLADDVGNRFLGGVARVSATSVHARSGEPQPALAGLRGDHRRMAPPGQPHPPRHLAAQPRRAVRTRWGHRGGRRAARCAATDVGHGRLRRRSTASRRGQGDARANRR